MSYRSPAHHLWRHVRDNKCCVLPAAYKSISLEGTFSDEVLAARSLQWAVWLMAACQLYPGTLVE
jgi:hypothetical protein